MNNQTTQITPKKIKAYLDTKVIGQEQAKIYASVLVYNHLRGIKDNMLFAGPSGCGKTEIFRQLSNKMPKKIFVYDASHITDMGYAGDNFCTCFAIMENLGWLPSEIENCILVFDEFDKLVCPHFTSEGTNLGERIQGEFLTMLENGSVTLGREDKGKMGMRTYSTKNMSFVFCGAFSSIFKNRVTNRTIGFNNVIKDEYEDTIMAEELIEFGITPELAGRISTIVCLKSLNTEQIKELISSTTAGPLYTVAQAFNATIVPTPQLIDEMVAMAQDEKRGVRALSGYVRSLVNQEIFEAGSTGLLSLCEKEEEQTEPLVAIFDEHDWHNLTEYEQEKLMHILDQKLEERYGKDDCKVYENKNAVTVVFNDTEMAEVEKVVKEALSDSISENKTASGAKK